MSASVLFIAVYDNQSKICYVSNEYRIDNVYIVLSVATKMILMCENYHNQPTSLSGNTFIISNKRISVLCSVDNYLMFLRSISEVKSSSS